jgi:hypothetical protein
LKTGRDLVADVEHRHEGAKALSLVEETAFHAISPLPHLTGACFASLDCFGSKRRYKLRCARPPRLSRSTGRGRSGSGTPPWPSKACPAPYRIWNGKTRERFFHGPPAGRRGPPPFSVVIQLLAASAE